MECDTFPKTTCQGQQHTVVEMMNVVKGLGTFLAEARAEVSNSLNEAAAKREQAQEYIQVLMDQNSSCLKKLRTKIEDDSAIKLVGPAVGSAHVVDFRSLKNGLEKKMKEARGEVEEANRMLRLFTGSSITGISVFDFVVI